MRDGQSEEKVSSEPSSVVPKASSLTHEHLLSIVTTELWRTPECLRILDVGCGRGEFLAYLSKSLRVLRPDLRLECYGFDVMDSGMMLAGFQQMTVSTLAEADPTVDWPSRITVVRSTDPWPYEAEFFDVIVSNQVMEHVDNHHHFLAELKRTLKEGGYSAHLFPLAHCIWEGHIHLPFLHWIKNHDLRVSYIRLMTRLRLLKPYDRINELSVNAEQFSERESDVMRDFTNYLTQKEIHSFGRLLKLRTSFRYTHELYFRKLSALLRRQPSYSYDRHRSALRDWVLTLVFRYVSSVTLFLEKHKGTDQPPIPNSNLN